MKLYLVRHTSVVWDGSVICYGNTDVDVRASFPEEAERAKQRLEGIKAQAVYTSPLTRAVKLAEYCGYADAERDDRLKEMNFGLWEGRFWEEIIGEEQTSVFFDKYIHHPTPEGESQMMQLERIRHFIEEKRAEGKESLLIFCHGGVINCIRSMVGEVSLNEAFATIPDFGSLTILDI